MSSPGAQLRDAMANGMVLAPFVYDGFTALVAEGKGAKAVYMTGHGTSAQIGLPDVGLTSMAEMVGNLGSHDSRSKNGDFFYFKNF
jgi:2-methylisocitrate lyase-like PEP mutase family enzyme